MFSLQGEGRGVPASAAWSLSRRMGIRLLLLTLFVVPPPPPKALSGGPFPVQEISSPVEPLRRWGPPREPPLSLSLSSETVPRGGKSFPMGCLCRRVPCSIFSAPSSKIVFLISAPRLVRIVVDFLSVGPRRRKGLMYARQ